MEKLLQELRLSFRLFRKSPSFAIAAVVTLALAIGASTAIFSVVNAVLLQPLSFKEPDQLVVVWENNAKQGRLKDTVALPNFLDWKNTSRSFQALAAYTVRPATLRHENESESVTAVNVTADFFKVLGAPPLTGRFPTQEEIDGFAKVAVLNEAYWQRSFGSSLAVVNKSILLNGEPVVVIGVAMRKFAWPEQQADVWVPMQTRSDWGRGSRFLTVIGRLRAQTTYQQAQADLSAISRGLAESYPETNRGWDVTLVGLAEEVTQDLKSTLLLLMVAATLLTVIGFSNVTGLLMARAISFERDTALRQALGASLKDLFVRALAEGLVLCVLAGILGVALSIAGLKLIGAFAPSILAKMSAIQVDLNVLLFACFITLGAGLFLSVASVFLRRGNLMDKLKEGVRAAGASRAKGRIRAFLMVGEVALALILVVGAGLLSKTVYRLLSQNPGFNKDHVLVVSVSANRSAYRSNDQVRDYYQRLINRLGTLPSVEAVGASTALPMSPLVIDFHKPFYVAGNKPASASQMPEGNFRVVTPTYFSAMGIPVQSGRVFTVEDHAEPLRVVINQTLASQAFPNELNPTGKYLMVDYNGWKPYEVIGVVGDTRSYGLKTGPRPEMFFPQITYGHYGQMNVAIRTSGDPSRLREAVRRAVVEVDPTTPPRRIDTMNELISGSVAREKLSLTLLFIFSFCALLLALIGMYALLTYVVNERTKEMAIRMAVGAQRRDVLVLVLGKGALLLLMGVVLGLIGSSLLTQKIRALLYGVEPLDLFTYAFAAIFMVVTGIVATYVPAYRASRLDALQILRNE